MSTEEVHIGKDETSDLLAAYHFFGQNHLHLLDPVTREYCGTDDEVEVFKYTRLATLYAIITIFTGGHPEEVDWERAFAEGYITDLKPIMDIYDGWQEHQLGIHEGR